MARRDVHAPDCRSVAQDSRRRCRTRPRRGQALNGILTNRVSFLLMRGIALPAMSSAVAAIDLTSTTGYLVADARGRVVGRVEAPMYGTSPDVPDALAVRSGFLRRRRLVPADAISAIDGRSGVIGLRLVRESIQSFG